MPETPKKVPIQGYVDSRLRDVIERLADKNNIAISDCVAELLAKAVNRPDLAEVPRKRMGRPRGKVAKTSESGNGKIGDDEEAAPKAKKGPGKPKGKHNGK